MAEARAKNLPVDDKIHTWPHLVRGEFLMALFVVVVLTLWSITVDAPLEEPANPTRTPNPSKAPWYFLGLQEMLVYFDPWNAGVVLPSLIIVGLMVIPYIDINPKGNGYYCFKDRKYEILTFFLGFHVLWVSMIIIGTFFRGPGWNLFWPWQQWDPHKVVALTNVDLPYLFGFQRLLVVGGFWLDRDRRLFCFRARGFLFLGSQSERQRVSRTLGDGSVYDYRYAFRPDAFASRQNVSAPRLQCQIYSGYSLDKCLMFYVAKILQALGLADVGYSLFVGITKNFSMAEEIVLALIGLGVFSLGRVLERKVA